MKIKRKALSVLSCLALIASSLPSTTLLVSGAENKLTEPGNPQYVTINGTGADQGKKVEALFANGTDITVTYNEKTLSNTVTYTKQKDDGSTVEAEIEGVATTADIFAGCHGSSEAVGNDDDPVEITIDGAHLNTVYGGGLHESTVKNVKITVKGDAQLQWVCGGGANALIRDEDCKSGAWESDAATSKTVVNQAEINIEKGTVSQAVYGGGQGNSRTEKTTVNIKGGTIDDVFASGSNGKTESAEVNISGGNINGVSSVNRGTIDNADVNVSGGEIKDLYIGAHSDYSSSTGTVTGANVNITGGTVKELHAGKSNQQDLDIGQETYSFSADPSSVEKYSEDIEAKKDEENAHYYFKAYKADGQEANGSELAKNIIKIVMPVIGSDNKAYQFAFVMANGETVVATDVKDESGAWKATRFTCTDGSYVDTNYDAIHLFGGKHNDDTLVESTDVTLDGTTHVQTVWGGGLHESQTGTTKVTVKGNAEVKGIQGGAANFFAGTNCGTPGCEGYNGKDSSKKCFDKPAGKEASDYNVSPNARVEKAEVIVESCKTYKTPSNVEGQTLIYGGGEALAYTGECTVTIKGGTFKDDAWVIPAGSNGYTGKSTLVVDGEVEIPNVGSGKSGIVKEADIEVKNGTVKNLTVGMIESPQGYGEIEASDVTVSGGTVSDVKFGYKNAQDEIKPESDEGYTLTADGGKIEKVAGTEVDYTKQDIVCDHGKYGKTEETKGTPATCAEDGTYDYYKCTNCNRYLSVQEGEIVDVTNEQGDGVDNSKLTMNAGPTHHVFLAKDVVAKVEPTCTDTGKEAYAECSVCHQAYAKAIDAGEGNYTFEDVENEDALTIKALGHDNEDIPAIDATCTQNGRTAGVKCKRCNAILVPPVLVDMAEHTYGQEIAEKKATCKDPGTKAHYQCSVCKKLFTKSGEAYTEVTESQLEIAATNEHTWGAYTYNDDATCTENGTETAECSVCHQKDTREKAETAKGHTISEEMIPEVPATCTEDGVKAHYECTECDALFIDEVVEEETVKKEVTAEELVIKAGHKAVEDAEVKATCTSTGLTAGSHCDVCGAILKEQLATPMLPHTEKIIDAVAPTCTQFGWTAGSECAECHGVLTVRVVVPALGHDYKDGVCTRCGEKDPSFTAPTVPTTPTTPTNITTPTTVQPSTTVPAKVLELKQAKVTKLKVKSKAKNKINISWKKVANAKGYQIEVSKSSTFKKSAKVLKKTTKNLKLTIKNKKLKSKKTYYVRARAYTTYKAADGSTKKAYSKWNFVLRKVKIK